MLMKNLYVGQFSSTEGETARRREIALKLRLCSWSRFVGTITPPHSFTWRKLDLLMASTFQESLSAAALQRPETATAPSAHDPEGGKK